MEEIVVYKAECDGYTIILNSPIVFELDKVPDEEDDDVTWYVAHIDGFKDYSECFAEDKDLLLNYCIPKVITSNLESPPCEHSPEEYRLFWNFLKNSVDTIKWVPAPSMKVVGQDKDGTLILDFIPHDNARADQQHN